MNFETIIVIVFILGYVAIAIEHSLKVDKLVPALVNDGICLGVGSIWY